ncbi:MAG: restriction endonuclease subunit S [Clostridium sp.]|uniref:restriction endonuclease subunit S n=1 Tax=Clostridium sp. TaxID=1506 RepID=UPI002A90EFE6|nr:restriction endonuclease subunit S [Clostridium sp.]MDY6229031.1 restriction endonuclease subunit S [Clostridium sp.]
MKQYRLGDIAKIVSGSAAPKEGLFNKKYGLPFIRACHLEELCNGLDINNLPKVEENLVKSIVKVPKDTIIFAKSGMSCMKARVYKTQDEAFIVSHLAGVICSDIIESSYLKYYFQFNKPNRLVLDDSYPSIRLSDIADIKIEIPDKEIQIKTAHALDKAQELIDKRKDQIKALDELVKSKFIEMFGDPINNPKGWEIKKLKDISTKILSGNTPKGGSEVYVDSGIMFFRSQNVWKNKLVLDDIAYIDKDTHNKMLKSSLKNRDILMTKTGRINTENSSLGRASMYLGEDDKANINGHVYLIRLKENILNEFVLFILTSKEYRGYIRSVCVGGIDKRQLNKEHIEDFPIIFPPIEQQKKFVAYVNQVDKLKFEMEKSLKELEDNFNSLMQRAFK